ncbi:hypothetical protein J31TS4_32090 [Paenibacillus sp. J31TS4]|uniref:twin-arginine translocase TatA/TatE family subunit n=1 Tax=Paenibacillus sp. J31TS4 TaxID=2807195 RepID=UPI001B0A95A4|nr:twin-arginine translocase TatA/TatE family subunit [Paenibacillus sp. J31TS4]GIP39929.1 hypothetical protein J31TS4_32090 [Paenibacillus sp. J31TS4]
MFLNIGLTGWILIALVVILVMKPSRLPALGRAIRSTIGDFRKSRREESEDHSREDKQDDRKPDGC